MKNKISFSIEPLLFDTENPKGAIELVLFANKMAEHENMPYCNRLVKLIFTDPKINKAPGAVPLDETLIIGYEDWNHCALHLCVKSGRSTCKIATGNFPDREINIYDDYRRAIILCKLSDKDIKEIFNYMWDNMNMIKPNPIPMSEDW
ncbi:hypothetical protein CMT37_12770 [Elizabethkingia anophelis]|nr:hypothetical protein [Elizabethkingia anophelis]